MASLGSGFDEALPLEERKDGNVVSVQSSENGEKLGCDDAVCYEDDDARRKKARHESIAYDTLRSSSLSGMALDHLNGLHGAHHCENSALKEADVAVNSAMMQTCGEADTSPTSNTVSPLHGTPSTKSMPSQNATDTPSGALGGEQVEDVQENVIDSADDSKLCKKVCEDVLLFGSEAPDESQLERSHNPYTQTSALSSKGNMHGLPRDPLYKSQDDIHEGLPADGLLECHSASQNGSSGLLIDTEHMHSVTPPHEAASANGYFQIHSQQKTLPCMEFLDLQAAQHSVMDRKEEPEQFSAQNSLKYGAKTEHTIKYMNADDLLPNGEDIRVKNQAQTLTKKIGSLFSRPSHDTLQPSSLKNLVLGLRFGSAIFSLIVFSVIISTREKRIAAGSTFFVKFSDYQAYNYLAAINLLTFLYSSGQLVMLAQGKPRRVLSSRIKWGTSLYLCDQMLAFLMISSSSSAATAAELSWHGLRNIWPPACSTWKLSLLCSRADVAVGMSFVSCFCMFLATLSSGYWLSNLLAE